MAFPGTVTLRPATFRQIAVDLCFSLCRHRLRRQPVVNGHGGNTALVAAGMQELGFDASVTCSQWTTGPSPDR